MCRKLIYLISSILVLSVPSGVCADLVGHWALDEGSGTTAHDSSANGNDGTFVGNPTWIAGVRGAALEFHGLGAPGGGGDHIDCGNDASLDIVGPISIALWIRPGADDPEGQGTETAPMAKADSGMSPSWSWQVRYGWGSPQPYMAFTFNTSPRAWAYVGKNLERDEWVHIACSHDGATLKCYVNGEETDSTPMGAIASSSTPVLIGSDGWGCDWIGAIDDVRLYDHALAEGEILAAMEGGEGYPYAFGPSPADGAIYANTWASLTWKAGDFAVSHNVYIGVNFDDVNDDDVTGDTFVANVPENYITDPYLIVGIIGFPIPEGLVPGTTYYWRVDEVNDANVDSPWKGNVWSFSIPSRKAIHPVPSDGARFVETDVTLTWTAGFGARTHAVFFGDDFDTVNNATTGGLPTPFTSYIPPALELDKTYYWRVDETDEVFAVHKGDVWSFGTLPDIPLTDDPNLIGWWKLDETSSAIALDWSGRGNHATLAGNPQWVEGYDGGALQCDGAGDWATTNLRPADWGFDGGNPKTVTAWVYTTGFNNGGIYDMGSQSDGQEFCLRTMTTVDNWRVQRWGYPTYDFDVVYPTENRWVHFAQVYENNFTVLYANGVSIGTQAVALDTANANFVIGRYGASTSFAGIIDDLRVYNKALTQEEVKETMRGDPLLAWDPMPTSGSTPNVKDAQTVSWSPGEKASQHDVYFGTDEDAVKNGDASDTTGTYRGRQGGTSYTAPEGVEWGTGPYYWRIDEYNTDATLSKGRVWNFTVADFIGIDNMESYDVDNAIWANWHDGLGYVDDQGVTHPGNGTGSEVGDPSTGSYTEETIRHSGSQSMPYWYNNSGLTGKLNYSEAKLTLTAPRDWTQENVRALSVWFQGRPGSVGSFVESPPGTYTMTATGGDIWYAADEFHYAYKMLSGVATIMARVESVGNTDPWAKAGVMIRETLEPGSKFAAVYITPGNGCRFQARIDTDVDATSDTPVVTPEQTAITAPYWVRLERDVAGNFTGFYSSNGATWQPMSWNPQSIQMNSNVYVGLALTAHNAAATCQAVLSNVTITGNVSGAWTNQDIGIESNAAEPMYVAVANSTGTPAVVYHDDPAAAQIDTWTEWNIDLKDFQDKGINLTDVDSIALGFGDRNNPQVGGSGKMYFDDIRLYRPRCVPDELTLSRADLNSDCVVDYRDLEIIVGDWLAGDPGLAGDLNVDDTVDFNDYAVLADQWLDEQIWPE